LCDRVTKEAEANRLKLTPQFLELRFIEAIANNSKIYFGEKVRCPNSSILEYEINCVLMCTVCMMIDTGHGYEPKAPRKFSG
jgi:hypothetical protein